MRRVDSCIVVPAEVSQVDEIIVEENAANSSGPYMVGSRRMSDDVTLKQTREKNHIELWPCSSMDLLTLEKGFALDTCW